MAIDTDKDQAEKDGGTKPSFDVDRPPLPNKKQATKSSSTGTRKRNSRGSGSTLRPIYGERRPMMYHLFETEMQSISAFNGQALRYFSFGSFLLSICLNIGIAYYFYAPPVPPMIARGAGYGIFATLVLSVMCFGFGVWALCTKRGLIRQIREETKSEVD